MIPDDPSTWAETLRTFSGLGMGTVMLALLMGVARLIDRIAAARKTEAEARAIDAATAQGLGKYWAERVLDLEKRNAELQKRIDRMQRNGGLKVSTDLNGGALL